MHETCIITVTTTQDLLTSLPLNPGSPGLPGNPISPLSPLEPSCPWVKNTDTVTLTTSGKSKSFEK